MSWQFFLDDSKIKLPLRREEKNTIEVSYVKIKEEFGNRVANLTEVNIFMYDMWSDYIFLIWCENLNQGW